jgi:DNA modification methylase
MAKGPAKLQKPFTNKIVGHEEVALDQLLANPRNFRFHPDNQQQALAGSIDEVGFIRSLTVNRNSGAIIDGHARVTVLMRSNVDKVTVEYVDLTDEEEASALLMMDAIAEMAAKDKEKLDALMQSVKSDDERVNTLIGEMRERENMQAKPNGEDPGAQVDKAQELLEKWQVKPGDMFRMGEHRLICGDSTDRATVGRLLMGDKVDILLNDPPYGMRLDADFSGMVNHLDFAHEKGVKSGKKYSDVIGDHEDYNASPIVAIFQDTKEQFWWGADYYSQTLGDTMHEGAWLVWDKRLDESADKMYGSCFELLWSKQKHKRDVLRHKWAGIFGTEHEPQRGRMHPNQKPVELYEDLLTRYSDAGAIIVDCYAGSGTTLIACERLKRKCRAVEISPAYVAVALERWSALTGLTPELIG